MTSNNMPSRLKITGSVLARNTLLNFIGQVVPLVVGVVTTPFIVRGLGTERFGLLSLAWVILGYFFIFDLGLGRATTKYVAEALGKGEEEQVPRIIWTTVTIQTILGFVGTVALIAATPFLVESILNIPMTLVSEAKAVFYILALAVPIVLISGSFFGVLEAAQRFDVVNAIRIPSSISAHFLTLIGLFSGFKLFGIVVLILIARSLAISAAVMFSLRLYPRIKKITVSFVLFPRLFVYGGWITLTNIVGPILVYLDRFLIAFFLSVTAVAYYTAPYDAVTRLWIIPGSLITTLFPAFSALEGIEDRQRLGELFARSVKYELLCLGPIVLVLVLFAEVVLQVWLGSDFAAQSKTVMQILALGVLANSIAHVPYALLQGVGRPDIAAKFHLLELPIYAGIAWFLISKWGIAGAAVAWTTRVALDAFLLFVATFKVCQLPTRLLITNSLTLASLASLLLAIIAYGLKSIASTLPFFSQSLLFIALFGLFAWFAWRKILDASDKGVILWVMKRCQKYLSTM